MDPSPLLDRVLDDEGLTVGLDEPEATALVRAVAHRVRRIAAQTGDPADAGRQVDMLCRHARATAVAVAAGPSGDKSATLRRLIAEWPA